MWQQSVHPLYPSVSYSSHEHFCERKKRRLHRKGEERALFPTASESPVPLAPNFNDALCKLAPQLKNRRDKAQLAQGEQLDQRREERELLEARTSIDRLERELGEATAAAAVGRGAQGKEELKACEKDLKDQRKKVSRRARAVVLSPGIAASVGRRG